jgi:HAMP domain-containing protein
VVTLLSLLGVGLLAQRAIRRGMRPLEEIAGTARPIGGGDLSRRVDPADPRTEVGRLGQTYGRVPARSPAPLVTRSSRRRNVGYPLDRGDERVNSGCCRDHATG